MKLRNRTAAHRAAQAAPVGRNRQDEVDALWAKAAEQQAHWDSLTREQQEDALGAIAAGGRS